LRREDGRKGIHHEKEICDGAEKEKSVGYERALGRMRSPGNFILQDPGGHGISQLLFAASCGARTHDPLLPRPNQRCRCMAWAPSLCSSLVSVMIVNGERGHAMTGEDLRTIQSLKSGRKYSTVRFRARAKVKEKEMEEMKWSRIVYFCGATVQPNRNYYNYMQGTGRNLGAFSAAFASQPC
jgi:hypothetical protein